MIQVLLALSIFVVASTAFYAAGALVDHMPAYVFVDHFMRWFFGFVVILVGGALVLGTACGAYEIAGWVLR